MEPWKWGIKKCCKYVLNTKVIDETRGYIYIKKITDKVIVSKAKNLQFAFRSTNA